MSLFLNQTEYAKHRGVSQSSISRHVLSGKLKGALKKKTKFWKIGIKIIQIIFLGLAFLALFYLIRTKNTVFLFMMLFFTMVVLDIFCSTTYQNIIEKIYQK